MNRKDVVELLNEFMTDAQRNVDTLDEVYKEFQVWNSAVLENIKLRRSGKNVSSVPPTPGATLRIRRKLSTIGESPGDEGEGESRAQRTSKDTGRIYSSPKHLKRTRLSYDDEEDNDKTENDPSQNSEENSQNVSSVNTQGLSLQNVHENDSCDASEERRGGRRGRRTKQSSILGRKQVLPARRNTRSNARLTRSITYDVLKDCDRDSQNVTTLKSISSRTQESISEESACRKGRRTNRSSIARQVHRVSSRISRCYVSVPLTVNDEMINKKNPQIDETDSCNLNTVHESSIQERRVSNNGSEKQHGISQNSSLELANDISQDSLTVPCESSHPSISRSLEDIGHKIKEGTATVCANSNENDTKSQNSDCETLNAITRDSPNISTVTETVSLSQSMRTAQDDTKADSSKRLSSNSGSSKNMINDMKELSICLTRIDGMWNKTLSRSLSEEFLKGVTVQSGIVRRKSEVFKKRSLNVITASEAQKRSNSFVDNRLSKKSRYEKNDQEIEVEHLPGNIKESSSKPEASERRKNERLVSSKLSETNNNKKQFVEIQSFGEISISGTMVENASERVFEELGKEHDKFECDDKNNSGKGNSDNGLEHSEYYSLVDAGEMIQDDKDACSVPKKKSVTNSKLRSKPSLQKKKEETLQVILEQNTPTPDRTISRKGGKSPALFSAYANEPVKNRVAAYEGLSTVVEELRVPATNKRVTRTKTRAMAAAAAAAAVAAAAAAPIVGASQQKAQSNITQSHRKSGPSLKVTRASWRLKKKLASSAKKNDASKENSFQLNSSKNADKYYKNISGTGGKILADVNGMFSPVLNNSKKTPMTGPRTIPVNNLSASQISRSGYRPGVILSSVETFLKKPVVKPVHDAEIKKLEEQKRREEKEREALRRREEMLKKQAEEKKKKRDEIRLRVQEKREAQEKEKQESKLRVGKEKDEKWHILQQEREAKQKGNALKKKLESERKAAEARRKLEEAESARIAKLKMEEMQNKKEHEEAEKERLRQIAKEKEATLLREQNSKVLAAVAKAKAENQKNTVHLPKPTVKAEKALDATFTKTHDSTFTLPSSASKKGQNLDNAYNLEEIESGDSDDEDCLPKHTARWAIKSALLWSSRSELKVNKRACQVFYAPDINISAIFPRKAFKRTSSAIWTTPPRYSVLPKY